MYSLVAFSTFPAWYNHILFKGRIYRKMNSKIITNQTDKMSKR